MEFCIGFHAVIESVFVLVVGGAERWRDAGWVIH